MIPDTATEGTGCHPYGGSTCYPIDIDMSLTTTWFLLVVTVSALGLLGASVALTDRRALLRAAAVAVVLSVEMPPTHSGFHARGTFIYLPPAWFGTPRPELPVIVLLSGSPGTPADWTRSAGADVLFDEFAKSHNGTAPVLVMPDANG